jgi:dolichol-phosphate mannosyltransferase
MQRTIQNGLHKAEHKPEPPAGPPLNLLTVVLPARDEEGCIASTVEHLHLELRLHNIAHEIIVVDDGSTDHTAEIGGSHS